jgi:dTDP-glucose 4,6-dehydratase
MKLLITGGAGFIGSALVRIAIANGYYVVNVDKLTYASNLENLKSVANNTRYIFEQVDICNSAAISQLFKHHKPDAIIHLAAESHVDRSIDNPTSFIHTNIIGTYLLLEASLNYYESLPANRKSSFRFIHVSTDEVFGSLDDNEAAFNLSTPYNPRSPYSSSKASSDHLARAWFHTYGLPVLISNCSNNYGPYQFPEKFIPLIILNGINGKKLPVYGDGKNSRDWLYVDDHCQALLKMLQDGEVGETYLIGGNAESRNIDTVKRICHLLDELEKNPNNVPHTDLIEYVTDRPGHDLRYAIDSSATKSNLNWQPSISFSQGLRMTVKWYIENQNWWKPLLNNKSLTARSGLGRMK